MRDLRTVGRLVLLPLVLLVVLTATADRAFGQAPGPPALPLELQVVIVRAQGDKVISRTPYVMSVISNGGQTNLNLGAEVPVPSTTFTPTAADKKEAPTPLRSFNYRSIGTIITVEAQPDTEQGRFRVTVSIEEASVYTTPGAASGKTPVVEDMPMFRTFRTRNVLLLRDGQTRQYTAATERVSGEVIRIEAGLKVLQP